MKIAYLCTHYPSVSHTFIQGEIRELEARGHVVVPIALNAAQPHDLLTDIDRDEQRRTYYVKATPRLSIAVAVLATALRHPVALTRTILGALRWGGSDIGLGAKSVLQVIEGVLVRRHCRRNGVTAIHAHFGQAPASVALFTCRLANAFGRERWTWSVTIHGWHDFTTEDTSRLRPKMRDAAGVVAISDFTRAQLMRLSDPVDWPKINVVRCGIDLGMFHLRESAGGSGERALVVLTGRLSVEKGHVVLIEAMARLRDRGVQIDACFVGEGPFREELERRVAAAHLDDQVRFAGALAPAAVADLLRQADAFCLPSFAEGLPVSIMEAMAVGVPVVASSISGTPELVVNGATGWAVPAGNVDALADALRRAISAADRDALVAGARAAVEARHDRRHTITGLERALLDAHERGAARSELEPGGRTRDNA